MKDAADTVTHELPELPAPSTWAELLHTPGALCEACEGWCRVITDTMRLDCLERLAREPGGLLLHSEPGATVRTTGLGLRPGGTERTLRDAIDCLLRR